MNRSITFAASLLLATASYAQEGEIVRDGEFRYLEANTERYGPLRT